MIGSDWADYLFKTYIDARLSPGWDTIYSCHDDEDKDLFFHYEELYSEKKIQPLKFRC